VLEGETTRLGEAWKDGVVVLSWDDVRQGASDLHDGHNVVLHEFAHQILNAADLHNAADENSYEYPSPDRAAQYYGQLHWTTARPLLEKRLR
jgi:hypothetical protein